MADNDSSELQAVDFGLGAHLAGAFTGLNAATGPKAYQEFLTRPVNKQIFRHDSASPHEFLNAFRSAEAGETIIGGKKINLPSLPLMVYWRKPGFTPDDQDRGGIIHSKNLYHDHGSTDEADWTTCNLSIFPVILEYKLAILAWDKPAIDKLCLAMYAYLSNKLAGNHKFTLNYRIGTEIFDVRAEITDPKATAFADTSMDKSDGRLFSVETDLTVNTRVLFGSAVTWADPIRFEFILTGYCGLEVPCGG